MIGLDTVRLIAAVMVIWGHSYVFTGRVVPTLSGIGPHNGGVAIFFALSGYLIAASWNHDRDLRRFAIKRALRIWPPLATVVFFTAFVLGPMVTVLPASTYFADPRPWLYVMRNLAMLPRHDLPGVFLANPYPVAVNGSLWTLPVEVACYAAVPLMFVHRLGPWLFAFAAIVAAIIVPVGANVAGFGLSGAAGVFPFFAAGALAFVLGVYLPQGVRLPADVSYGLYLVSFPLGQTIVSLRPGIGPVTLAATTLVISMPLAWLLHVTVELPIATLKRRTVAHAPPRQAVAVPASARRARPPAGEHPAQGDEELAYS